MLGCFFLYRHIKVEYLNGIFDFRKFDRAHLTAYFMILASPLIIFALTYLYVGAYIFYSERSKAIFLRDEERFGFIHHAFREVLLISFSYAMNIFLYR